MNRYVLPILREELPRACQAQLQAGARFVTMVASDERMLAVSGYVLRFLFFRSGAMYILESILPPDDPTYPSVTPILPAAAWYEREGHDLFGLQPQGHPDLRRLILHEDWPQGVYPLRKDYTLTDTQPRVEGQIWSFPKVEGAGVFEVPVGPIHAGVIEPGHFRFQVMGDSVLHLEAKLFYKHRGLEKRSENVDVLQGRILAERICGVCNVSHSLSYAHAVEQVTGTEVPTRARYLRSLFAELERLYNHIGDIGNVCAGIGFAYGANHGARLKEQMMQLNDELTGHRYLRGTVLPGGVLIDVTDDHRKQLWPQLKRMQADLNEIVDVMLSQDTVLNRLATTGVLPEDTARAFAAVGPAARASGIRMDARLDYRYDAYPELEFEVPTQSAGDVLARFQIRVQEVEQTLYIIRQILDNLPEGPLANGLGEVPMYRYGIGITESPRGENVHFVMTGEKGTLFRYRIRSASYANWPVVPLTVPGNLIADFPLINKSFELCYACCDR